MNFKQQGHLAEIGGAFIGGFISTCFVGWKLALVGVAGSLVITRIAHWFVHG